MFNKTVLPNGLTIASETIPFVRSVSFGIWVKNGSRHENTGNNGISHFIEHMLFKGTENRTAKDIADSMDQVGGQLNAFTSKEYTCYYTRTLDSHFDIALDVLSDMFFHSKFDESDIQKERNVILEEISMYEDTPEDLVHDLLQLNIWKNDPLGFSILGTADSISSLDRKAFVDYFQAHYRPDQTVIAIAGNFEEEVAIKKIEACFGHFKRQTDDEEKAYDTAYHPCVLTKEKDIEQVHLCMSFPSISIGSTLAYPLAALNTFFGGGMSSRLFQTIREEHGYAYSVYSYNTSYTDTGLFTIYAGLNPTQSEPVIRLVIDEINRLFFKRITLDQLEKTKEQLKSNYVLSLESSTNRMNSIGRSQLMLNRFYTPDELIEKIEEVTLDHVYQLTEQIFDMNKLSLCAVGCVADIDYEEILHKCTIAS